MKDLWLREEVIDQRSDRDQEECGTAKHGPNAGSGGRLSTLRPHPRGYLRMTRGRCGSLVLHRNGLAPSTSCRPSRRTRGSMAGLCTPLPTLRLYLHRHLRTARGRCGSLLLHRGGLSRPTPCRFHRRTLLYPGFLMGSLHCRTLPLRAKFRPKRLQQLTSHFFCCPIGRICSERCNAKRYAIGKRKFPPVD